MSTPHAAAEWEKHIDDETQTAYYYNTCTGESSWEKPEGFVDASADSASSDTAGTASEPAKPPRWRRYIDDSNGKSYYYDEENDVTQWEEPEGEIRDASGDEDEGDDDTDADEAEKVNEEDDATEQAEEDHEASSAEREDERGDEPAATKSEATVADSTAPAAHNWVKHLDKVTGKPYYHDTITSKTQWEEPEQYTEAGTQTSAVSAEYLEYLHRSRAEKLARATQRVLDPQGNLSRLNALLSKIGGAGAAASGDELDAPEDIEQGLKERARAEWQQHVDPHSQRYYYHNIVTGETQWQKPDAPIVSALADWIPPETPDPDVKTGPARTVSGHHYAATAKFNRLSGRFEKLGGEEYFETRGVAGDREGRQMSHFFDVQQLEKNREEAKRIKEQLKRKNVDWKKVAAEKKARKQKRQNEWIYQD